MAKVGRIKLSQLNWNELEIPRSSSQWRSFLNALVEHEDYESEWLEQKSQGDPMKGSDLGKLAKCILGMANRSPIVAAKYMNGHGLMVWGLQNKDLAGIKKTEDHQLQDKLTPYLTGDGPYWRGIRIAVKGSSDREVLIVVVDPSNVGDPIFLCHKNGEGIEDGGIYVRDKTQTRRAKSDEIRILEHRSIKDFPAIDLSVSLESPLYRIVSQTDDVEAYIERVQTFLRDALPEERPADLGRTSFVPTSRETSSGSVTSDSTGWSDAIRDSMKIFEAFEVAENRTRLEYLAEIDEWVSKSRQAIPEAMQFYLESALPHVSFKIENHTNFFLKKLQLEIHIEGEIRSHERLLLEPFTLEEWLSPRPRRWGPYTRNPFADFGQINPSLYLRPHLTVPAGGGPHVRIRNDESVGVTIKLDELRPKSVVRVERQDVVLMVAPEQAEPVHAIWTATAVDLHSVIEGSFDIPVVGNFDTSGIEGGS